MPGPAACRAGREPSALGAGRARRVRGGQRHAPVEPGRGASRRHPAASGGCRPWRPCPCPCPSRFPCRPCRVDPADRRPCCDQGAGLRRSGMADGCRLTLRSAAVALVPVAQASGLGKVRASPRAKEPALRQGSVPASLQEWARALREGSAPGSARAWRRASAPASRPPGAWAWEEPAAPEWRSGPASQDRRAAHPATWLRLAVRPARAWDPPRSPGSMPRATAPPTRSAPGLALPRATKRRWSAQASRSHPAVSWEARLPPGRGGSGVKGAADRWSRRRSRPPRGPDW